MPSSAKQPQPAPSKIMKVNLWLRFENNNKYIRGKKKAREEIEDRVLSRYQMKKIPFLSPVFPPAGPFGRVGDRRGPVGQNRPTGSLASDVASLSAITSPTYSSNTERT